MRGWIQKTATGAAIAACAAGVGAGSPSAGAGSTDPVVVAAGDIACDPTFPLYNDGGGTHRHCAARRVSNIALRKVGPDRVLALGDLQYDNGRLWKFRRSYESSWGRLASITSPAVGNHEYQTPDASGYFDYFNGVGGLDGPAGTRGEGWYSFDAGEWHLIALNSNCDEVDCTSTSPQVQWLQSDLAEHPDTDCVLAYWHHPRFSSGEHQEDLDVAPFWDALYAAGADLVLAGHDHDYEHFSPQSPAGAYDPQYGLRQFVVGTGGKSLRTFPLVAPNSWRRHRNHFGLLKLTLRPGRYRWRFVPYGESNFEDSGSRTCHAAPPGLPLP